MSVKSLIGRRMLKMYSAVGVESWKRRRSLTRSKSFLFSLARALAFFHH